MAEYGETVRRLMADRDMSLRALAKAVCYDVAYLSRTIAGKQRPSRELVAALDEALGADGQLNALRPPAMSGLTPDDTERLARAIERPARTDREVIRCLGVILAEQRRMEDSIGAAPLVQSVTAQAGLLRSMAAEARGPGRRGMLDVAGQWAQFTGWLHTASEDYAEADRWFSRSLEWGVEAQDDDLAATVLSFKGHVAWLRGHVGPVIGLSQAAQRYRDVYPGQLAYDALQEARGHAILGDTYSVDRLVAEADRLVERALVELPHAPPWHYYRSPAFWDLERGRAYARLAGREKRAADLLAAGLDALPGEQVGADWVTAYRRDLAACT